MGENSCYSQVRDAFTTRNVLAKILFAEFLGTFVLIVLGDSSVAQNVLSRGGSGEFITVNMAWGLAVAMGVWVSGEVSGGHINPAVTFAFTIMGRCPWSHFPIYWIGQYLGAFAGAAVVYGVYYEAINDFDGGTRITDPTNVNATAGIFATYPKEYLSTYAGFGDQIVGTAMLMMLVMAITDQNNQKPHKGMVPFAVGLVVMVIGMALGHNCGYAINPARDWGPRILTLVAGWGTDPFTYRDFNWFWVPFAGPHVGAIIGGWMYLLFVGNHIRPEEEEEEISDILESNAKEPRPDYEKNAISPRHNDGIELRGVPNSAYDRDDPYTTPNSRPHPAYARHVSANRSPYYDADKSYM